VIPLRNRAETAPSGHISKQGNTLALAAGGGGEHGAEVRRELASAVCAASMNKHPRGQGGHCAQAAFGMMLRRELVWAAKRRCRDNVDAVARKLSLGDVDLVLITACTRKARSAMVIFSFTRSSCRRPTCSLAERCITASRMSSRDGAGVHADPADHGASLDHGKPVFFWRRRRGRCPEGRNDHDQVIFHGAHARSLQGSMRRGRLAASTDAATSPQRRLP